MKKRISHYLSDLKGDLRYRAIHTKDENLAAEFWRMYYKAKDAEHEVREMVQDAEMRRLIEFAVQHGLLDSSILELDKLEDDEPQDKPDTPDSDSAERDEDKPPKQKGFWD